MRKNSNPSNRLLELDALRGLSAISVLLFHYTTFYGIVFGGTWNPPFEFPWIPYRLQLFSLISGFVILLVLDRTEKPLDFAVARFSRLYPCYFVAVILIASLLVLFPLKTDFPLPGRVVTWEMFFMNFTMIQSWLGYADVDGVFWFLAPEISFYMIIFFLFMFKKIKYLEFLGFFGLLFVVLNARYGSIGPFEISDFIMHSRILCFWHYFFAGILFYNLKTKGDTWWRHSGIALCFVVHNLITDNILSVLCFGLCMLMFYLFIYGRLTWIAQKPLLFLGTISYSLYLVHQNIGYMIIRDMVKAGADPWALFLIPTLIAIGIASAMTYWVEKPATKFIRTKYKEWFKKPQEKIEISKKEKPLIQGAAARKSFIKQALTKQ